MRVVLVLCLLAFMSCQIDITNFLKCLYESPKVKEIIADVMVAIATKDFSKLWPKVKDALPELIPVVINCVAKENSDEVNLQYVSDCYTCKLLVCLHDEECIAKYCLDKCRPKPKPEPVPIPDYLEEFINHK